MIRIVFDIVIVYDRIVLKLLAVATHYVKLLLLLFTDVEQNEYPRT